MKDLIEKLESAMEGSRELDYLIHGTIKGWRLPDGPNSFSWSVIDSFQYGSPDSERTAIYIKEWELPEYTTSLDAALALVPNGYCWQVRQGIAVRANVWSLEIDYADSHTLPQGLTPAAPALALCIAALKARAQ